MRRQQGLVLVMAIILTGLLSFLVLYFLNALQLQLLTQRHQQHYLIAFRSAEEGIFLGFKKLPKIGAWSLQSKGRTDYSTRLSLIDSCQRTYYQIRSVGFFEKARVELLLVKVDATHRLDSKSCEKVPYSGFWQQIL